MPSPPPQSARIALAARRSARVLEGIAGVLALATIIGNWIAITTDTSRFFGGGGSSPRFPFKYQFAQFVQQAMGPLAWSGLVLAAGFGFEIVALRAERAPVAAPNPFAPDPTSSVAPAATATSPRGSAVPAIVPRRQPPITVDTVDDTVWRR
jgi:hypothetical protein